MFKHAAKRNWKRGLDNLLYCQPDYAPGDTLAGETYIGAAIELNPEEAGKEWTVEADMLIRTEYADVLIYEGFIHDGDTFVYNFRERDPEVPALITPIGHDFSFVHRMYADGTPLSFREANATYCRMCRCSTNFWRRQVAEIRWLGVSSFGYGVWLQGSKQPIPDEHAWKYGMSNAACCYRATLPLYGIGPNRRLQRLR